MNPKRAAMARRLRGEGPAPTDPDRPVTLPNRRERRLAAQQAARGSAADRRRHDGAVRAKLREIQTVQLEVLTLKLRKTISAYYPNVWDLSQAPREHLLQIDGVGKVRLRQLQEYLEEKGVVLVWGSGGRSI